MAIKFAILDGSHPRGVHLKEEELAGRIGVSRTPIREALRRLDADGLVKFVPNQGAFVCAWDEEDLVEIFALRMRLESYAVERATLSIGPDEIAELRDLADRMEAAAQDWPGSRDAIGEYNSRFHWIILKAAHSKRIEQIVNGVAQLPHALRTFRRFSKSDMERSFEHHREMLSAFAARDAEWAGAIMRAHIQAARNACLRAGFDGRPPLEP